MWATLAPSLVKSAIFSVVKGINWQRVREAGRGYMDNFFFVLLHPLGNNIDVTKHFNYEPSKWKVVSVVKGINWKRIREAGRGYMDKFFLVLLHPLSNNIDVTKHFNYEPRFNGVFSRNNLPRTKDGAYVINFNDKCSIVNLNGFIE